MSKVKAIRQPTAEATLIFEFEVASSEFLVKNFTDGDIYASLERDATKEQSVLIPAQTAQRLQYGSYGGGKSNLVQIIPTATKRKRSRSTMLKMVDGTGIIGVDMVCPLGGTVSPPQPPNYDRVELEGTGMLVLPNSLDAPLERLELGGKTEQAQTSGKNLANPSEFVIGTLAGKDTGNIINLKQYITTGYIPVIPGKRYSTSCGNKFLAYTIIADHKEKTKINYPMNMSSEMPEGAAYIRLSYKKIDMTNVTESDMEELKKVCMVNEGSTVLPYQPDTGGKPSPSLEYEQEVKNAGKWNEGTQKYEVDVKVTNAEQNWNKEQTLTLTSDRPLTKWDRLVEQGGRFGWLYRSEIDDNVKPSRTDLFPYGFSLYKNQENGTYTYKSTNIKKAIGFQTSYCKQFRKTKMPHINQRNCGIIPINHP